MTDQKDLYRAAQIMIHQHDDLAENAALDKMQKFMDTQNVAAASMWLMIAQTIKELQQSSTNGTIH